MATKTNKFKINYTGVNFRTSNGRDYSLIVENAREVYGHDDSYPFNADWKILDKNSQEIIFKGKAWNDGWGGSNDYSVENGKYEDINAISCELKNIFKFRDKVYKFELEYGFDDIVGILAFLNISKTYGIYTQKAVLNYISR